MGDLDKMRFFLEHGHPVDQKDEDGLTAFQLALKGGHVEVARLLAKHGARTDRAAGFTCVSRVPSAQGGLCPERVTTGFTAAPGRSHGPASAAYGPDHFSTRFSSTGSTTWTAAAKQSAPSH